MAQTTFLKKIENELTADFMAVAGTLSLLVGLPPEPAMVGTYQLIQDAKSVAKLAAGKS